MEWAVTWDSPTRTEWPPCAARPMAMRLPCMRTGEHIIWSSMAQADEGCVFAKLPERLCGNKAACSTRATSRDTSATSATHSRAPHSDRQSTTAGCPLTSVLLQLSARAALRRPFRSRSPPYFTFTMRSVAIASAALTGALAIDNGKGITPPLGWRSWNLYGANGACAEGSAGALSRSTSTRASPPRLTPPA